MALILSLTHSPLRRKRGALRCSSTMLQVAPVYAKYAIPWARRCAGVRGLLPSGGVLYAISLDDERGDRRGVLLAEKQSGGLVDHICLDWGVPEREAVSILRRASQQARAAMGYATMQVPRGKLAVTPITVEAANEVVDQIHRHHEPVQGAMWAVAVVMGEEEGVSVRGVAIVGHPQARKLMEKEPRTLEILRVAADGTPHVPSMLLGACERAAAACGWSALVTYTLMSESGSSLRGAGWKMEAEGVGGGDWGREGRPRVTKHPTDAKRRWRKKL